MDPTVGHLERFVKRNSVGRGFETSDNIRNFHLKDSFQAAAEALGIRVIRLIICKLLEDIL